MSSLTKENIPHLCRACLRNLKKNKHQPILDEPQQGPAFYHIDRTESLYKWMTIINPLEEMTRLKNSQHHQQYPEYVCRSCYENFKHLNDFKEMVVHSFSVLSKLLANGNETSPETQEQQSVTQCELVIKTEPIVDAKDEVKDEKDDDDMENEWDIGDALSSILCVNENIKLEAEEFVEPVEGTSSPTPTIDSEEGQPKATKAYKCPICKNSYVHKYTYVAHIRQMHLGIEQAFECDVCHRTYTKFCNLYRHMRKEHNQSLRQYKCQYSNCNRSFRQLTTRRKHYEKFHNNKPLPKHVKKMSKENSKQDEPQNSQHSSKEPSPSTSTVNKETTAGQQLHNFSYTNKRYICTICTASFETSYDLKVHTTNDHKKDMKFRCHLCGKRKISQIKLDEHINTVHQNPNVSCNVCQKVLKSKSHLRQHILSVHNGVKPYSCEYCPAKFAAKNTLKVHTRLHTGEKPFKCCVCERRFTQLTPMKKHLITHEKGHRNAIE